MLTYHGTPLPLAAQTSQPCPAPDLTQGRGNLEQTPSGFLVSTA